MIYDVMNDIMTNAIENWDYSSVFPSGYTGISQPIFVPAQMWQLEAQIEILTNGGQFTQPIISIETSSIKDEARSLSDIYGLGQLPSTTYKLARRVRYPFIVATWADQQLGGMTIARKLAGQLYGALFYYRNRLSTIRHITLGHSQEIFYDQPQLHSVQLSYEGDVLTTIDV